MSQTWANFKLDSLFQLTLKGTRLIRVEIIHKVHCSLFAKCRNFSKFSIFFDTPIIIIFFPAARITTAQTTELGSNLINMQKLLSVVRTKKEDKQIGML